VFLNAWISPVFATNFLEALLQSFHSLFACGALGQDFMRSAENALTDLRVLQSR
jgi:hypothetical protein